MRSQQRPRLRTDRRSVVPQARAVGGPDLDQTRASLHDDLRDPEGAPDLDQLAAGHDQLAPAAGERRGGEENRGGAVVDRQRPLGTRELAQQALDVHVT